jgi:mannose-6-phosphate isomerase-like protein (cupin superfamily)
MLMISTAFNWASAVLAEEVADSLKSNPPERVLKPFSMSFAETDTAYKRILGEANSAGTRSGRVVLMPGQDVGKHSTGKYEEIVVVLSGDGEAQVIGGESFKITANSVVYYPPNTEHNIVNTSKKPLVYIYVAAPTSK